MTTTPPQTVPERDDTRDDGPMTGAIRPVIDHWLDTYRETVLLKVAGLTGEQLCERSAHPSSLSLIGVVRHLTEVEAYWIREVLQGRDDVPDHYSTPRSRDGDFDDVTPLSAVAEVEAYAREVAGTRAIVQG